MANTNCLAGMRCPQCQSEGPFKIAVKTWMLVYDDGTEFAGGDTEWEDDSACGCVACGYIGTVRGFTIPEEDSDGGPR